MRFRSKDGSFTDGFGSSVSGGGGFGVIGGVEAVVSGLAHEVDAEGDKGDAKTGGGVAEVVGERRVLPPLVPPPEELPSGSQWLPHSRFRALYHKFEVFFSLGLRRRRGTTLVPRARAIKG